MTQTRFQYECSKERDARRNAKKHKDPQGWAWVVLNPKTWKYATLFGETEADGPTRVKPLYTVGPEPVYAREYSADERMCAIIQMIDQGVIAVHAVNVGYDISAESVEDLCDEWHENGHIDWSAWDLD